jgi:phospholipid transport system transporter-binding protein
MSFEITTAGPARLEARGELGFGTAADALHAGLALLGPGQWVVDLARVTSADSAGLAVLIEWLAAVHERGGALRFESVPEQLVAIARISDLDGLLFAQSTSSGGG